MEQTYAGIRTIVPPMQWLMAYLPWSFEEPEEIEHEARITKEAMIRSLKLGPASEDRKLGKTLRACRDFYWTQRCGRPICPVCVERLRRSFILEAAACIAFLMQKRKFPISSLCADLPGQCYQLGDLRRLDLTSLNRRIRCQYARAGFPLALSGIHLALIEDRRTNAKPVWQARVCSVIAGLAKRDLPASLAGIFPPDSWRTSADDHDVGEALYDTIQPVFYREVIDKRRGGPRTRSLKLQPPQMRELAHWLARYDMSVRYSLVGCRRNHGWVQLDPGVPERLEQFMSNRRNASP
jgi:hypothetical protein